MEVTYQVTVLAAAAENLARLDKVVARRITTRIRWLSENFDVLPHSALTADLSGLFKLRAGNYRIIYSVNPQEKIIIIHSIGHRRDIYKEK